MAARAAIVGVCLLYLLDLDCSCMPGEAVEAYPLAEYAARYWARHAAVVEESTGRVLPTEEEYFSCRSVFEFGYRLYSPDNIWQRPGQEATPVGGLYYVCFCGLLGSRLLGTIYI
ncbi:hypothetical protein QBC33DRAFT_525923 [Phialemonium atrogriseum]|uniref:Leishmanolysin-like peptidase n=1 Tax=Phialemonium atrogriseum TaxID=1093897 RepID=A0AAJ0C8B7_9PEZI|nr:uncharacterized protein QBC33DRAFT_525923 [Phialemonium atrogriseum]KAK1770838.1 hypothetical protein QBC33DRAFT_525923 [Phialemonium atrogriseum]